MNDLTVFDWVRWVEAPVLLAMLGLLIRHVMSDHTVELAIKTAQARLEGKHEGLGARITRLEDINDDRSTDDRRARRSLNGDPLETSDR